MRWLDAIERAGRSGGEDYPPAVSQRIVYVLTPVGFGPSPPRLGVNPISTRLLKDGRFSEAGRPYEVDARSAAIKPQHLRPSDLRILAVLARMRRDSSRRIPELFEGAAAPLLADILATGRVRWLDVNGAELSAGEPLRGRIDWRSDTGEALRPVLEVDRDVVVLNGHPPVYVDAVAGRIGPVETGLDPGLAAALLEAPPVPAGRIAEVNAALARRAPDLGAARLPEPEVSGRVECTPTPRLRLIVGDLPVPASELRYTGYLGLPPPTERVPLARLSFGYGGASVRAGEADRNPTRIVGRRLVTVRRDLGAERRCSQRLAEVGLEPVAGRRAGVPAAHAHDLALDGDAVDWFDLLWHDLPALRDAGWSVEIADDFPFRLLRGDGRFDADLREGSGVDWLELEIGVDVDGERIDLVGPLVALISRLPPSGDLSDLVLGEAGDEAMYLPLADGRVVAVPASRLLPIAEALTELALGGDHGDGRLRLTAADAASVADFEAATLNLGLVLRGGEALRDMGRKLTAAGGIPAVALPPSFRASLRPYQMQGVAWLSFLRDVGLGGVLADDMGLGKTIQALALLAVEKAEGRLDRPALVVAPTSLMENWRSEAERFAPDLAVLVLQGEERRARFERIARSDLVLSTYPLVARDHAVLAEQSWHVLILDEAQTVKNAATAAMRSVASLDARHRFCLTGTPVENNLGELWSLFSVAVPGLLGDRQSFARRWRTPIEKGGDAARSRSLARRVRPFLLRRTKGEVARELPPKTEIVERVALLRGQRDVYEAIRLAMHRRVQDAIAAKGFARSRIVILDALLKMRQVCCDPRLLESSRAGEKAGSAKLERLDEMVGGLVGEGRRILIFSQFTSMLDLIRPRLDARGVAHASLTGATRDRPAVIRRFEAGGVPVFLVSLKAGGTGLNLTSADTVILYDPWWNPAVEEQAIDRVHRIGQDKPVFVHKLVASGTIEEKMETLKAKKRALAQRLFDEDGAPTLAMTEGDLEALFAPD